MIINKWFYDISTSVLYSKFPIVLITRLRAWKCSKVLCPLLQFCPPNIAITHIHEHLSTQYQHCYVVLKEVPSFCCNFCLFFALVSLCYSSAKLSVSTFQCFIVFCDPESIEWILIITHFFLKTVFLELVLAEVFLLIRGGFEFEGRMLLRWNVLLIPQ